jgi:hypothetical protein
MLRYFFLTAALWKIKRGGLFPISHSSGLVHYHVSLFSFVDKEVLCHALFNPSVLPANRNSTPVIHINSLLPTFSMASTVNLLEAIVLSAQNRPHRSSSG